MGTGTADAEARAQVRAEKAERLNARAGGTPGPLSLSFYTRLLFGFPPLPRKSVAEVTADQLREARGIAAREFNCRPEDVSDEVVASVAQTLAINQRASAEKRR